MVGGAKNAALPVLAMTVLTSAPCNISNFPQLNDIHSMTSLLTELGAEIKLDGTHCTVSLSQLQTHIAPYDLVRKMRASILLLGPLLARAGRAKISLPGGCAIGLRPVDQHLKAISALGAQYKIEDGYIEAWIDKVQEGDFCFDKPTVTGTMNAIFLAAGLDTVARFKNCAVEPEVIQVATILEKMGASIEGVGTKEITVRGRSNLDGFSVGLIPDRIEAGTFMVAAAITQGDIEIAGVEPTHLDAVTQALSQMGVEISYDKSCMRVKNSQWPLNATDIVTTEYPGFPTDMQAQIMALLVMAEGSSIVEERIFENRFMHVAELNRMGAGIEVRGRQAIIPGGRRYKGAPVMATDLRASAGLILAGLAAEGETEVLRVYHLDRGYEKIESKLFGLGAHIQRHRQE